MPNFDDLQRAKGTAFQALTRRAMTEREIRGRLVKKGFDEQTVEAAVGDLKCLKLIDDAAFAQAWIEERMRLRPMGRERLEAELASKGVAEEIRTTVLNKALTGIDPALIAVETLRKKTAMYRRLDRKTAFRRMIGFLKRRGFDDETAISAVETVIKTLER